MPRKNLNVDGGIGFGVHCKVRKRGSSSSSSSTLVRNSRLKRAILVGKRGGSSTPVPMWKTSSKSPSSLQNDAANGIIVIIDKGKELSVSARKLAATLWEINGVPAPMLKDRKIEIEGFKKYRILNKSSSNLEALALYNWSDPSSSSPLPEEMDRRRASISSHKILPSDCNIGGFNSFNNARLMEVDPNQIQSHGRDTPRGSRAKNRLKDLLCALTTSKELLKILNHIWRLEEKQPPTSISLLSALKAELDRACIQASKLIHDQKFNQGEVDLLLNQFEEEKATWKIKEKERIRNAISSVAGELEIEKKLKRQTERLNKKLGIELADTKATLLRTTKELESEKRAREILEQVCDELATGIGEDRAKVEELKRESEKLHEEVEKEREMLQLADVLREERVQMKLSEARYQFEEKNAVVEKLRGELESYLRSKVGEEQVDGSPNYARIKELEQYLIETLPVSSQYQDPSKIRNEKIYEEDQGEAEDSGDDSELHSIELNMGENSKSYKWSEVQDDDSKNSAMTDNRTKGRSDKRQRQSISIERQTSDGIEWEFSPIRNGNPDVVDGRKVFDFSSQSWKRECEDELERYNMIKDLRDHIVSGARTASSQQVMPSQNPNTVVCVKDLQ